jgi:hypothetical protein
MPSTTSKATYSLLSWSATKDAWEALKRNCYAKGSRQRINNVTMLAQQ